MIATTLKKDPEFQRLRRAWSLRITGDRDQPLYDWWLAAARVHADRVDSHADVTITELARNRYRISLPDSMLPENQVADRQPQRVVGQRALLDQIALWLWEAREALTPLPDGQMPRGWALWAKGWGLYSLRPRSENTYALPVLASEGPWLPAYALLRYLAQGRIQHTEVRRAGYVVMPVAMLGYDEMDGVNVRAIRENRAARVIWDVSPARLVRVMVRLATSSDLDQWGREIGKLFPWRPLPARRGTTTGKLGAAWPPAGIPVTDTGIVLSTGVVP